MPFTTGAVYNPPTGSTHLDRIQISCLNDSIISPINLSLQIFHFRGASFTRVAVGETLFQLNPQQLLAQTYSVTLADYYEVQINFYSAVDTIINIFALDAGGNILDRILQPELTYIDRLSIIST
ncbi:hypothetical protein [Paenibacillus riograndensis]|uniref:Uncharacterized protein n=2 Tax=Paenibacillus riograndensis TaxID=483937 RepID=A0A132U8D0_9BACL|nr:hypothetical protein [Paenibacillus riograndensis]KWX79790.1 hypothetical protein AMQ84_05860 [Paenibacillus riograndensis]KWX88606.1 hypothetical protein AMQ83_05720 [Paenibacillus riograndensis]CQR54242.1 hypothetical protein PRIO_1832 [Paenibacillus riograndensis SBR5]